MDNEIYGFWERLSKLAKQKDLALKQACEDAKLSYNAILNKKVQGKRPALDKITVLAEIYGTTIDYLVTGREAGASGCMLAFSFDEEQIIMEYRTLDSEHKAEIYSQILRAKQDMFSKSLKKESSISGIKVG